MMLALKIAGTIEIILLAMLVGLGKDTRTSWMVAALYCAIVFLTCVYVSLQRMQYAGWWGWFITACTCVVLPLGVMLSFAFPESSLQLFAVTACVVVAERFREQRTEERQLGWLALPIASCAIAVLLSYGRVLEALHFAMAMAAFCSTVLFFVNVGRRTGIASQPETQTRSASALTQRRPRSIGRAA
jgi:hypothetical protein